MCPPLHLFILPDLRASACGLIETDERERLLLVVRRLSASCSGDLVLSSGPVMWKKSVRPTREETSAT